MTERLPRLTEADLNDAQLEVYRSITGGPRASGKQLFALKDESGALNGPFGVMLHAPELGLALQELGAALRYRTRMTDRCREIAILMIAVGTASEFEWYAHERVGRAVGLTEAELEALRDGTFSSEDRAEQAIADLCDRLLAQNHLDDEEYAQASAVLDNEEILEVTVLVGYYRTLAQMMHVFKIEAPVES